MDSITHIALGACMGEAFAGKKLGKRALVWGALAHSFPDIDFITSFWMDTPSSLLAHRGFTHSFLFAGIAAFVLALVAERWHRPHDISLRRWFLFFATLITAHVLLDALNNYGVGWWEPFSHQRISFHTIYVADPFFSVWPGIALAALLLLRVNDHRRAFWWKSGLVAGAFYLCYCGINKLVIEHQVQRAFREQNIPHERYFTTPAPLQNWLWFVVAGNDKGYFTGFRSLFDRDQKIAFEYFPRNTHLLDTVSDHENLQKLVRFSQEFYTVEYWNDTLVLNDLRFGQIIGWQNRCEHFVFHFFLSHPQENRLVVQRGRFDKWDRSVALALLRRMMGN
ncbi:MAG TPA: metal-dependent hydrolase [Lacibacter sp.]|nr:metal-dependent hydrolase [Lacibacter sp.]HMO89315.1 metal-dependent hydrolase [Lacibacter sp.]